MGELWPNFIGSSEHSRLNSGRLGEGWGAYYIRLPALTRPHTLEMGLWADPAQPLLGTVMLHSEQVTLKIMPLN